MENVRKAENDQVQYWNFFLLFDHMTKCDGSCFPWQFTHICAEPVQHPLPSIKEQEQCYSRAYSTGPIQ